MNSETLHKYIDNPSLLDLSSVLNIEALLAEYPYFQTGWVLYAKNLYDIDDVRFKSKIKQAALHCPDRLMLYKLINRSKETLENQSVPETEVEEPVIDNQALAFEIAEQTNFEKPSSELLEFAFETLVMNSPVSGSYIIEQGREAITEEGFSEARKKKIDLLDKFISDKPKIIPKETEVAISSVIADYEKEEQDDFITETLARIYIRQGHFEKALHTYEKLSLKYPEKSIYFASQIKLIKELIDKNV